MSGQTFISGFVYDKDRIQQAEQVERWAKYEQRKTSRQNTKLKVALAGSVCFLGAALFALDYAVPAIRLLPVFLNQQSDGVLNAALTTDSIDSNLSDATIKSALYQYVMWRESYSWTEHDADYYRVSVMSANPVKKSYEAWYSGKEGFMANYTDKASVRIKLKDIPANEFSRPTGSTPGHFSVYFYRQVQYLNSVTPGPVETWKAELQFAMNYPYGWKVEDIMAFNPLRIVVTAYPGSQPVAMPMAMGGGRR